MQKESGAFSLTFMKRVTPEKLTEIGIIPIFTEDVNKCDVLQLDATMTVLLAVSISSTCFGQLFSHLQER